MGRAGPETRLVRSMRLAGRAEYGSRLVVVKYHGNEYSEAGVSDLLCCLDGVFVAVEAKVSGNSPTLKQRAFGQRIESAGGVFAVCYSVEEFLETLAQAAEQAARADH